MTVNTDNISWLGHDSVLIKGRLNIYIDPWEVTGPPADLILITHSHPDHLDLATIVALAGPETGIVADIASAAILTKDGTLKNPITALKPGEEVDIKGVKIQAVPAYNLDKEFHPKSANHVGFVISGDGPSVYHAGDTDFIPEMKNIKAQVALLPVSGTYVMTAEEAVEAALAINPEVVIPMHYGKIIGDVAMAEKFAADLLGKVAVVIKAKVA